MSKLFKRTKILATIGPATFAEDKLRDLVYAGLNGFRINFSHAQYDQTDENIRLIRQFAAERGRNVTILQDLAGPKIRLRNIVDNHYDVHVGDELILDYAVEEHDGSNVIPVQYNLAEKVKAGEPVYIWDGKVKTICEEVISDTAIRVRCQNEGYIMSRKGVNLPDTDLGGDVITEKDIQDIEWGATRDFDYLAMSFVQCAEDIRKMRKIMAEKGHGAKLIAKIETKKAIENDIVMEEIVKEVDGIMIARGDMGIEAGNEVVPVAERRLIEFCRKHCKLVIVATQTMMSMCENPEPTRAEVNDVATAVLLGADVVMLSDETANGKYPIEAVKEMRKTILYTQNNAEILPLKHEIVDVRGGYSAVAESAVKLAEKVGADLIVSATRSGATSMAVASQRPKLPVLSVTPDKRVAQQLALVFANTSVIREVTETWLEDAVRDLKASGYLQTADGNENLKVVIVSGLANPDNNTGRIEIRTI